MDREERRIRKMYRGHPEYYRKLQEYQIAKTSSSGLGKSASLLQSAAESPPVTQFYRQSQVRAGGNQPAVQTVSAPGQSHSAGTEVVPKGDAPVLELDQASRSAAAPSPPFNLRAEPPPVTDFYRQFGADRKQTSVHLWHEPGTPSHAGSLLKSDKAPAPVANEVTSAEGIVLEKGSYYLQVYKEQIRAGLALPYAAAKAIRDQRDRSRGRKRRMPSSPSTPTAEEGI